MVSHQCDCIECHWTLLLKMVTAVNVILCLFYHNKKLVNLTSVVQEKKRMGEIMIFSFSRGPSERLCNKGQAVKNSGELNKFFVYRLTCYSKALVYVVS